MARDLREAAVLVPLYRDAGGRPMLLVIRRTEHGVHGGQLAFPGGTRAPEDRTLRDTALREACEELGLPPGSIEILEELPILETRTTGYRVAPFLGRLDSVASVRPCEREVAEILEVPLAELALPQARGVAPMLFAGLDTPVDVPFFHVGPHRLWGLSYRILEPLLPRLLAV